MIKAMSPRPPGFYVVQLREYSNPFCEGGRDRRTQTLCTRCFGERLERVEVPFEEALNDIVRRAWEQAEHELEQEKKKSG